MSNISLLLLTHNDSEKISKNFKWLKECPSITEVVVVDDESSDDTLVQINKLKSKNREVHVYNRRLANDFSRQRQFGIAKTNNDWILWLDSDETPSRQLIDFLNKIDLKQDSAYSFKRIDNFLNKDLLHGENYNQNFVRLFNKTRGKFSGSVHETWLTDSEIINTRLAIKHIPHPDLKTFFQKINFYSDIRSQELYNNNHRGRINHIILYPIAKFFQNYIFKLGFLDGVPGIIMAIGMAFHSFLTRGKLWQLSQLQSESLPS